MVPLFLRSVRKQEIFIYIVRVALSMAFIPGVKLRVNLITPDKKTLRFFLQ